MCDATGKAASDLSTEAPCALTLLVNAEGLRQTSGSARVGHSPRCWLPAATWSSPYAPPPSTPQPIIRIGAATVWSDGYAP